MRRFISACCRRFWNCRGDIVKQIFRGRILTIPNLLSFLRLCMVPWFMWTYLARENTVGTALILLLSGLTDTADGIIARRFDQVTDFGKEFDPFADKVTQIAMMLCLTLRFPRLWWLAGTLCVKELFVLSTSLMAIHQTQTVQGANWHGKMATTMVYAAMVAHLLFPNMADWVSIALTAACTGAVLLSGVLYGIRNIRSIRAGKTEEAMES